MIQINTTIFPKVMGIALGKPHDENEITENTDASDVDISIDLPRGANLLYLEKVISEENEVEKKLLTQYAYGQHFSDEDYESLLKIIITPIAREWNVSFSSENFLEPFGVCIEKEAQSQILWDNGFRTYLFLLTSNSLRKKYSSSRYP